METVELTINNLDKLKEACKKEEEKLSELKEIIRELETMELDVIIK